MSLPNLPHYVRQRTDGQWEGADHPDGPWRIASPDGIQWTPWATDEPAVPESREPASVALEATKTRLLSPAAQAVLDAFAADNYGVWLRGDPDSLAAALRAVADQSENLYDPHEGKVSVVRTAVIFALADELEGFDG